MGSLTSALHSSANALSVFERTFEVIENNITNANTPGYAKQDQAIDTLQFDPEHGLSGGIGAGPLISSRSEYIETSVRTQQSSLGASRQQRAGRSPARSSRSFSLYFGFGRRELAQQRVSSTRFRN